MKFERDVAFPPFFQQAGLASIINRTLCSSSEGKKDLLKYPPFRSSICFRRHTNGDWGLKHANKDSLMIFLFKPILKNFQQSLNVHPCSIYSPNTARG
jgi:hypothetical protein